MQFPASRTREKVYYGWVIVGAVLLICTVVFGARYAFGIFFKSLESDFELSRAVTSAVLSASTVFGAIFNSFWGWTLDRIGPRRVNIAMSVVTGLGFLTTAVATAPWHLFLTYSMLLGMGDGMYPTLMSTVTRWFERRRGLAVGLAGCGSGFGILIMSPFSTYLLSSTGWRNSFLIIGVMVMLVTVATLLLRHAPMQSGSAGEGAATAKGAGGYSLRQAWRTKQFWLIAMAWFLQSSAVIFMTTHIVPHVTDLGFSRAAGALVFAIMGVGYVGGRLLAGGASDGLGRKTVAIACALLGALAMAWLVAASELWMLYLFAIALGLSWGGLLNMVTLLVSDVFGTRGLGSIMGATASAWILGSAVGPLVGGLIFDITNAYGAAFLSGTGVLVVVAVLVYLIKPLAPANRT